MKSQPVLNGEIYSRKFERAVCMEIYEIIVMNLNTKEDRVLSIEVDEADKQ